MMSVIAILCCVLGGFMGIVCLMWITASLLESEGRRSVLAISISGPATVLLLVVGGMLLLHSWGAMEFLTVPQHRKWQRVKNIPVLAAMNAIAEKVREIETEMQRIGFWSPSPTTTPDGAQLYSGLLFEQWLQFVFLPAVKAAVVSTEFSSVPPYRVGLAALRNYDYHSTIEEALPLVQLCHELEALLSPEMRKGQLGAS